MQHESRLRLKPGFLDEFVGVYESFEGITPTLEATSVPEDDLKGI